jgi:hypothetical protein
MGSLRWSRSTSRVGRIWVEGIRSVPLRRAACVGYGRNGRGDGRIWPILRRMALRHVHSALSTLASFLSLILKANSLANDHFGMTEIEYLKPYLNASRGSDEALVIKMVINYIPVLSVRSARLTYQPPPAQPLSETLTTTGCQAKAWRKIMMASVPSPRGREGPPPGEESSGSVYAFSWAAVQYSMPPLHLSLESLLPRYLPYQNPMRGFRVQQLASGAQESLIVDACF